MLGVLRGIWAVRQQADDDDDDDDCDGHLVASDSDSLKGGGGGSAAGHDVECERSGEAKMVVNCGTLVRSEVSCGAVAFH